MCVCVVCTKLTLKKKCFILSLKAVIEKLFIVKQILFSWTQKEEMIPNTFEKSNNKFRLFVYHNHLKSISCQFSSIFDFLDY